jgi:hydrogenase maturation protease
MSARILVAGLGNVFFGDDGFGVEVAQRLARRPLGDDVRVVDFGIRGFDLTYALLEDWDAAILVDAMARGGAPGTLYVIEPALCDVGSAAIVETHGMDPMRVLAVVRSMGGALEGLRVVGCEPALLGDGDEPLQGLSAEVEAAVEPAIALVEKLVAEARHA